MGTEIRTMQDGPDKSALLHFRRTHVTGNKYIHQYHVDEIWAPGDPAPRTVLRRLEKNKDTQLLEPGRIILSREEVFDGINEWHHFQGHMGQERTWGFCKEKFWNVTQQHVRYFCTTCFECMRKNPVPKKLKGSIKPIFSKNFRDRFQVDLINFRRLRKRDPFGVLMRWVMTLKDHATGLTFICALPRKQAHLVAYKLQEIFGVIGYPKIFHTDNGKEFTAKCVLELLRNFNPNIISVTGRPRRPRDQGSVENVNKLVKRVIGTVLSEQRIAGQNPTWTEILGGVAAVVNSRKGRGKNDVSAYEAVYGQALDPPLCCTKEEARRCWSVKDRMLVTIEPEFDVYIQENYELEDDINEVDFEDYDNDGYFSGDDLPIDEMNEVTDEWFESHLMDGCPIVDTPSTTPASHSKKDKKEHTKKNDIEISMSDRKPPPEGIVQMASTNEEDVPPVPKLPGFQKDDNGLIFGPSCVGSCFTMDDEYDHRKVKVQLNEVGQYVVFPSLWWHHGYYNIQDEEKVIFTAQLFATPSSDIGNTKRSNRRNSQMTNPSHGQLSTLNGLDDELFLEWDDKYSADQFPPASKFLGRVDKAKNRHILKHQIHLLPKIERLVLSFEEMFNDITVDSVWLIKKTKQDDGFQEWHQDMKTKITRTIVVNVGSGVFGYKDNNMSTTEIKEDDKNVAEINKGEKDMSMTETKENDKNIAEINEDDEDDVLDVEVIPPGMFKDLPKKFPFCG